MLYQENLATLLSTSLFGDEMHRNADLKNGFSPGKKS
jgi:hypothetical protein